MPDALELSLRARDLRDGEVLRAFVKAPFAGTALAVVMSGELHHISSVALPEGGGEIEIPVSREWGPGAYLMVTALRPEGTGQAHLPRRAMGLAWFSIDAARRRVGVEFEVPEAVEPRQTITLPVRLASAGNGGERVKLTIAAVDEGILSLTGFETPDPRRHYLGQRRLAMTVRDVGLFRVDGEIHAMENACPHNGDPLSEGLLDGAIVVCPAHGWEFDVRTGFRPQDADGFPIPRFATRVTNGWVEVDLDQPLARAPRR